MKEQKYHIYLTEQERSEVIKSLIDLKTRLSVKANTRMPLTICW